MKLKNIKKRVCPVCHGEGYDPNTYEDCEYCDDGFVIKAIKTESEEE